MSLQRLEEAMKKKTVHRLDLHRETLRRLSSEDIRRAGGGDDNTVTCEPSVSMPGCICLNTNVSCCC